MKRYEYETSLRRRLRRRGARARVCVCVCVCAELSVFTLEQARARCIESYDNRFISMK